MCPSSTDYNYALKFIIFNLGPLAHPHLHHTLPETRMFCQTFPSIEVWPSMRPISAPEAHFLAPSMWPTHEPTSLSTPAVSFRFALTTSMCFPNILFCFGGVRGGGRGLWIPKACDLYIHALVLAQCSHHLHNATFFWHVQLGEFCLCRCVVCYLQTILHPLDLVRQEKHPPQPHPPQMTNNFWRGAGVQQNGSIWMMQRNNAKGTCVSKTAMNRKETNNAWLSTWEFDNGGLQDEHVLVHTKATSFNLTYYLMISKKNFGVCRSYQFTMGPHLNDTSTHLLFCFFVILVRTRWILSCLWLARVY